MKQVSVFKSKTLTAWLVNGAVSIVKCNVTGKFLKHSLAKVEIQEHEKKQAIVALSGISVFVVAIIVMFILNTVTPPMVFTWLMIIGSHMLLAGQRISKGFQYVHIE